MLIGRGQCKAAAAAGWDLTDAAYDSVNYEPSTTTLSPKGLAFNTDGDVMYIMGDAEDKIFEYDLSTAWDISNVTYNSVSADLTDGGSFTLQGEGMCFKPDGTKLYVIDTWDEIIYQYGLSTAWDVSTLSYDSKSFDISGTESNPTDIQFNDDGTKVYISGVVSNGRVRWWTLSTAWDISTAGTPQSNKTLSEDTHPHAIFFKDDGTKMFACGDVNDEVFQYSLSTAWDASSLSYDSISFDHSGQDGAVKAMFIGKNGTKMYLAGDTTNKIYQYSL